MSQERFYSTHYIRCLKCNQTIHCSRYNTAALLEHIKKEHPEVKTMNKNQTIPMENINTEKYDSTIRQPSGCEKSKARKKSPECEKNLRHQKSDTSIKSTSDRTGVNFKNVKDNEQGSYSKRYHKQFKPQDHNNIRYRVSMENWKPIEGLLFCPNCCCTKPPLVKTRRELFTNGSLITGCVLSCWPLCFLPCCTSSSHLQYIHCSHCLVFLGLYDSKKNCVKPNKQYVSSPDENSAVDSDTSKKSQ